MTQKRKQGAATPKNQVDLIAVWHRQDESNADIEMELTERYPDTAPSLRTIQNITKRFKENKVPWDRLGTDGADVRKIFDVLAEVIKASEGKKKVFTQEEAEWITWVRKAAPTLPPYCVWVMVCLYMAETRFQAQGDKDFAQLDGFLALKPWESQEAMIAYYDMCQTGLMPQGRRMVQVAAGARQAYYQQQGEEEIQALKVQAQQGDPDAVMGLAMLKELGKGDNDPSPEQPPNQLDFVANVPTGGLPIDEQHAALGMVYTEEQEEKEE